MEENIKELEEKYIDILEKNDWVVSSYTGDGRVELETESPAGEDIVFCVEVENFPQSVRACADDFDAEEHAEMWIEARGRVRGVPNSIMTLVNDANDIQAMLNELADALEGKVNKEKVTIEEISNKVCNVISDGYDDEEDREDTERILCSELLRLSDDSHIKMALIRLCERIEELER